MPSGHAIILRLTKLSDTSLIVTWCVEGWGLVRTVAKGARGAKSSFRGKLDLFYLAELEWAESRKSELHQLRELTIKHYHSGLREHYRDLLMASYFCALCEHVIEAGHSDESMFDLLRRGLNYLDREGAGKRALEHFENELARMTGVWDGKRASYLAIEDAFGRLPKTRRQCLELLD